MMEIPVIDRWEGLKEFNEVAEQVWEYSCSWHELHDGLADETTKRFTIEALLRRIKERFVAACPFCRCRDDLSQSFFVVLPFKDTTAVVGMCFKLRDNGTTYLCSVCEMCEFWLNWFQLCGVDVSDEIIEF